MDAPLVLIHFSIFPFSFLSVLSSPCREFLVIFIIKRRMKSNMTQKKTNNYAKLLLFEFEWIKASGRMSCDWRQKTCIQGQIYVFIIQSSPRCVTCSALASSSHCILLRRPEDAHLFETWTNVAVETRPQKCDKVKMWAIFNRNNAHVEKSWN